MQKLMQRYVPAGCDEITRPVRGDYVGEPITRTTRPGDEIRIDDVRYAWPLDDDGVRCSWYY